MEVLAEVKGWVKSNWKKLAAIGVALVAALVESLLPGTFSGPVAEALLKIVALLAI